MGEKVKTLERQREEEEDQTLLFAFSSPTVVTHW